jgi:hypothetical protein
MKLKTKLKMIEDNPVQLSKLATCIIRPDHNIKGKQKNIKFSTNQNN